LLILGAHNRVDCGIDLLGASDRDFKELAGGDFALRHKRRERYGVVFAVLVKAHRLLLDQFI
jgi:hypothetical protein